MKLILCIWCVCVCRLGLINHVVNKALSIGKALFKTSLIESGAHNVNMYTFFMLKLIF